VTKHSWKVVLTDPDAILHRTNFVEWCEWCGTLRHTRRYWGENRTDYWYDRPRPAPFNFVGKREGE
jgi:hypothetical protein